MHKDGTFATKKLPDQTTKVYKTPNFRAWHCQYRCAFLWRLLSSVWRGISVPFLLLDLQDTLCFMVVLWPPDYPITTIHPLTCGEAYHDATPRPSLIKSQTMPRPAVIFSVWHGSLVVMYDRGASSAHLTPLTTQAWAGATRCQAFYLGVLISGPIISSQFNSWHQNNW